MADRKISSGDLRTGAIALGVATVLLAGTIGYRELGSGRLASHETDLEAPLSIDELRERAEDSGDADAWQALGFAYFERAEFGKAAQAYRKAVDNDDGEAVLWSALGEALVMASERDPMPAEALAAFQKASEIDPGDPRSRYFLAVNRDLAGEHEGAIEDWLALLADTAQGAPWERDLIRTIEQVGAINRIEVSDKIDVALAARPAVKAQSGSSLSGPTQSEIAAAGAIPPAEQRAMAENMVARLEQRLAGDPDNIEGWVMLMRSRMTLGEPQSAKAALDAAIRANPGRAALLRDEAAQLGVGK
ncbi:MAG: tetratricopeptide repeat protein [Sphingomonadaceae bacterium]|nr:MAG: tetratricopeptide repeat protein [Sphingomonadaceae bacterium]